MVELRSSVLKARVAHARRVPSRNAFNYGVDYLLLDEAALDGGKTPRLFSYGRFNLVSLRPGDHGLDREPGCAWVRRMAQSSGVEGVARIALLTHARYWGYGFNPVSFWLIQNDEGALIAVIAEVHNTFGDRHFYVCRNADGAPIQPGCWLEAEKRFHVSPFFEIKGRYRFRFALTAERIGVWIRYEDGEGGGLHTSLVGERRPFSDRELLRALIRRPLGSLKTTALIYWQALRLFLRGLRYRYRPEPPKKHVT